MNEMIRKLNSILNDSIVLRLDFGIELISSDLEEILEFSSSELRGKSFAGICDNIGDFSEIQEGLKKGYFDNVPVTLVSRRGDQLKVIASGFYLGMISEINKYIILKVKLTEDSSALKQELITKRRELDSFIYRTAHDLRGPLATIKGLVNLLKIRKNDFEVNDLTSLIEIHANKLDDRLFKLLYLADVSDNVESSKGKIDFINLETGLKRLLNDNCYLPEARFSFAAPNSVVGISENGVFDVLRSLLLYVISLPMTSVKENGDVGIDVIITLQSTSLEAKVSASGFVADRKVQEAIYNPTFLYSDSLNHPFLFNYYVAQKKIVRMNGRLKIDFDTEYNQRIKISIPLNNVAIVTPSKLSNAED